MDTDIPPLKKTFLPTKATETSFSVPCTVEKILTIRGAHTHYCISTLHSNWGKKHTHKKKKLKEINHSGRALKKTLAGK